LLCFFIAHSIAPFVDIRKLLRWHGSPRHEVPGLLSGAW
jgi:hypothetical protein